MVCLVHPRVISFGVSRSVTSAVLTPTSPKRPEYTKHVVSKLIAHTGYENYK